MPGKITSLKQRQVLEKFSPFSGAASGSESMIAPGGYWKRWEDRRWFRGSRRSNLQAHADGAESLSGDIPNEFSPVMISGWTGAVPKPPGASPPGATHTFRQNPLAERITTPP